MSDSLIDLASEVVIWDLATSDHNPEDKILEIGPRADSHLDTIFDNDQRIMVDQTDYRKGGRYYSVVKLQIRYSGQVPDDKRWAQGTGWLIEPDLLVTAGHCALDHTYAFGKASSIKAYVGYSGKHSLQRPDAQFRSGTRALTPRGWAESDVNRQNDVSFIKLDKPFRDIRSFEMRATPSKGSENVGVVGYPTDKSYDGERGGLMYEEFRKTDFDLNNSALNMLEHHISTFSGQSGCPMIIKGSSAVIGTHVYGLGSCNTASVIRGEFGNFYTAYQSAIRATSATSNVSLDIALPNLDAPAVGNAEVRIEGFIDIVRKLARVIGGASSATLIADSPSKGPIAVAIAGTALGIISAAATEDNVAPASDLQYRQFAGRAIMAEAALQAVLRMDAVEADGYGVMQSMGDFYCSNQKIINKVAPALAASLMDPALRLATSNGKQGEGERQALSPMIVSDTTMPHDETTGLEIQGVSKSAVQPSLEPASPLAKDLHDFAIANGESADSIRFFDEISSASDKAGAPNLSNLDSYFETITVQPAGIKSLDALQSDHITLCQRAFLGEAALRTINSMPSDVRVNGFFDVIRDTVKKIGPRVAAEVGERIPDLVEYLTPLVEKVNSGNKAPLAPEPVPILGRCPVKSIHDLLTGGS